MRVKSVSINGIGLKDKHLSLSTRAVALTRHFKIISRKRTLYISALQTLFDRHSLDEPRTGMGASYALGHHPIAEELRALGMGETAVERLYAPQMQSMLHPEGERLP
jgi:hypothetical protein